MRRSETARPHPRHGGVAVGTAPSSCACGTSGAGRLCPPYTLPHSAIRTDRRRAAGVHAPAIERRRDEVTGPDAARGAACGELVRGVGAVGILRLLDREPARHQEAAEIGAAGGAACDDAAVAVAVDGHAAQNLAARERVERIRAQSAAAIQLAVTAATELRALGRIDSPETDTRAADVQRVAIDDA